VLHPLLDGCRDRRQLQACLLQFVSRQNTRPPPTPTTHVFKPPGRLVCTSATSMSTISSTLLAWMAPACRITASQVAWVPAMAPVWEAAALLPASV